MHGLERSTNRWCRSQWLGGAGAARRPVDEGHGLLHTGASTDPRHLSVDAYQIEVPILGVRGLDSASSWGGDLGASPDRARSRSRSRSRFLVPGFALRPRLDPGPTAQQAEAGAAGDADGAQREARGLGNY